jgi:ABC-2 type transport system ATP-binding protein
MIEAKELTMHYRTTLALDSATFKVEKGEIMGLLGPNGAGKTTAMNIIATHLVPTGGSATVGGFDVQTHGLEARRLLGYLPEEPPLYKDMEVGEYLSFVGCARGLSGARLKERIDNVVASCGIKTVYKKLVRALSRGFRQRAGLAQALLHDPEVLILDEPTTGLDPLQIIEIRKMIKDLARSKTVIFSTHIMQEASAITDRIVIINEGRIIADSTAEALQANFPGDGAAVLSAAAPEVEIEKLLSSIAGISDMRKVGVSCGCPRFEFAVKHGSSALSDAARLIHERSWTVHEFYEKPPTLEDIFIALIKKSREKPALESAPVSAGAGSAGTNGSAASGEARR